MSLYQFDTWKFIALATMRDAFVGNAVMKFAPPTPNTFAFWGRYSTSFAFIFYKKFA